MVRIFGDITKCALAFSGGTDSAFLLYQALKEGVDVKAYYCRSQFQPEFEYMDALRLLHELNADYTVIDLDVLADANVAANPPLRCALCKRKMFSTLIAQSDADGYSVVIDGTNASDDEGQRPGMKVLRELGVSSPLREAGLTKDTIRHLSKDAGLFTCDKPSYSCLATRVQTGVRLDSDILNRVEKGETALMDMGFSNFRLRTDGVNARLEVPQAQFDAFVAQRQAVLAVLGKLFRTVSLDLKYREV